MGLLLPKDPKLSIVKFFYIIIRVSPWEAVPALEAVLAWEAIRFGKLYSS